MSDKINLQEDFLGQLRLGRHPVTVYTTNGFHMKGQITAYARFTIFVEDSNPSALTDLRA